MIIKCFRCKKGYRYPKPQERRLYHGRRLTKDGEIQKTAIICPKCYRKTDHVIWGVHKPQGKAKNVEQR